MGSERDLTMHIDLADGSDLEIMVNLCKDERIDNNGDRSKVDVRIQARPAFLMTPDRRSRLGSGYGDPLPWRKWDEFEISDGNTYL